MSDAKRVIEIHRGGCSAVDVIMPAGPVERVLYILPVERTGGGAGENGGRGFGDGLAAVMATGLAVEWGWAVARVRFDDVPFVVDHPVDARIRQESALVESVVPAVDEVVNGRGGRAGRERRLLLGFSKSGWAAVRLAIDHAALFGYAASWDAPLMHETFDERWEVARVFGTAANFQRCTLRATAGRADDRVRDRARLALLGAVLFAGQASAAAAVLDAAGVPCVVDETMRFEHRWESGWVGPALRALRGLVEPGSGAD